jgi:hypothetical protein
MLQNCWRICPASSWGANNAPPTPYQFQDAELPREMGKLWEGEREGESVHPLFTAYLLSASTLAFVM